MAGPDLKDYIEVPDRIKEFHTKYPEGSLQGEHELVEVGGKLFVQYIARAYRTPNDERPGIGTTWEPFPGTTPYTKNSEIENAETSAWGRALVALGFVGKKIASATEVRNRSAEQDEGSTSRRQKDGSPKPSAAQRSLIEKLRGQKKLLDAQVVQMVGEITLTEGVNLDEGWIERYLTGGKEGSASALIDRLMKGPIPEAPVTPAPEPETGNPDDFKQEPQQQGDDLPWDPETAAA